MDKNFCRQIDDDLLVEVYIAGKLKGELLNKFEEHLRKCPDHAQAVTLERALKRGVADFARGEIKTRLRARVKQRDDTRVILLRYAAILFIVVITPIMLYYQFNVRPDKLVSELSEQRSAGPKESEIVNEEESVSSDIKDGPVSKGKQGSKKELPAEHKETGIGAISGRGAAPPAAQKTQPAVKPDDQPIESVSGDQLYKRVASYEAAETSMKSESKRSKLNIDDYNSVELSEETDSILYSQRSEINKCINEHLSPERYTEYFLIVNIEITSEGKVKEVKKLDSSLSDTTIEECIIEIVKKWTITPVSKDITIEKTIRYISDPINPE